MRQTRFRAFVGSRIWAARWRLAVAASCTLGVTLTELLKPWPLKVILDHVVLGKAPPHWMRALGPLVAGDRTSVLFGWSLAIVLIAVLNGLFSYFQIFITSSVGYKVVYELRRELFGHLQRLSLSFHARTPSGELLTKIAGDTNVLKEVFGDSVLKFAAHSLVVVGMFAIMFALDWRLSLIAIAIFPLLCYSLFHLYRRTKASVKSQRSQEGKIAARMTEVLTSAALVQAFARERYEEERFTTATARTLEESIRVARLEAAATRSTEIITAVGAAAALLYGAYQVLDGRLLPGELILFSAYLTNMYKPIRNLARLSTDFSKAMASAERVREILELEPAVQDAPHAIDAGRLRGEISFKDVSFDYGDGRPVLDRVSFTVSPGQTIALVGPSGAGKSTIVSLVLRLYEPRSGTITIDGRDVRDYRRDSLRRQVGIVLQNSMLFGATVRENIAYGRPEATHEEIVAAARLANADDFIRELPQGYDTSIGERGATLSGGQQQRIAIARALIRDAPILILDEPMTGLDRASETMVREAVERLVEGRTCILITHDLDAARRADAVLVLDEGRVVEHGRGRGGVAFGRDLRWESGGRLRS